MTVDERTDERDVATIERDGAAPDEGPDVLTIVNGGELDMDALASLFA